MFSYAKYNVYIYGLCILCAHSYNRHEINSFGSRSSAVNKAKMDFECWAPKEAAVRAQLLWWRFNTGIVVNPLVQRGQIRSVTPQCDLRWSIKDKLDDWARRLTVYILSRLCFLVKSSRQPLTGHLNLAGCFRLRALALRVLSVATLIFGFLLKTFPTSFSSTEWVERATWIQCSRIACGSLLHPPSLRSSVRGWEAPRGIKGAGFSNGSWLLWLLTLGREKWCANTYTAPRSFPNENTWKCCSAQMLSFWSSCTATPVP